MVALVCLLNLDLDLELDLDSALGVSTLSYAWWMFTNKDLQHSNIFDFFFNSMIKRRYEKGGLDETRLEVAKVRIKINACQLFIM